MSVDGELAIVGTANMDLRSFRLNFEVCAVCYCGETARLMDEQFMADLEDSEAIRMKSFRKRPGADIFLENVARLTSSLL
jgi:phosphatidylserine/phosphatidylglycerophosphate/cardiolipin synthase-like enzyme